MPPSMAVFQNAYYIGNNFNTIFYGVELVLFFTTVRAVLDRKHRRLPSDKYFLLFSTVLLCLNTVFVATEAVFGEEMWIVHADYPGGIDAYLVDFASVWYQTFGTAASIVLNLLSDGLLIYRCWVVWDDLRVIAFPVLIYLASFTLGIAQLYESGRPHANYFEGLAQSLGIAYTSCIIALNVVVTALIAGRIYYLGRRFAHTMGQDVGRAYTGAAAIIVESALAQTLSGLAYVATFAVHSQTSIFFLSVYVMMECIAPQLIVLRVITGRAWTRDRSTMLGSQLEFTDRSTTRIDEGYDAEKAAVTVKESMVNVISSSGSNTSSEQVAGVGV